MNTVKHSNTIKHYMFTFYLFLILSAVSTMFLAKNVVAQTANPHEYIENQIHTYIKTQVSTSPHKKTQIIISPIDRRKRLLQCPQPLAITLMGKNGLKRNNTFKVACLPHWRIFVPVTLKTLLPIVTATKNIGVNEVLTHDNIMIKYSDTSLVIGSTIDDIQGVLGAKVKRYIQKDRPVLSNLVCMVCKNELVYIIVNRGNLHIKSTGKALTDGTKGQKVSIKNNSSGRIIEATVVAVGRAEINL